MRSAIPLRRADVARLAFAVVGLVLLIASAQAPPRFPQLTGRVVDEAALLTAEQRARLVAELEAVEKRSSDQIVVVTLKSLHDYAIEDYGYQLGRAWGIGQAGLDNGVLLIVAPNERKVRIEVGRGLEPQLTDALSSLIMQNAILPAFRRGEWAAGIEAGVRDIRDVLLGDADAVRDRLARGAKRSKGHDWFSIVLLLFWGLVVLYVLAAFYQQSRRVPAASQAGHRRGYRGNDPVFIPGGWGGSGNWGGSGGGGGGGGFGGGGGGFGGGGSSGSW